MVTTIDVRETQRLLGLGAQLVDVLPAGEFSEIHLPGAQNIPLKKMTSETVAALDKDRPVIVYCHDFQ